MSQCYVIYIIKTEVHLGFVWKYRYQYKQKLFENMDIEIYKKSIVSFY